MAIGQPRQPSYERLVRARATLAALVELHGDWLMPHFDKLDEACLAEERRKDRLAFAIEAARTVSFSGDVKKDQPTG